KPRDAAEPPCPAKADTDRTDRVTGNKKGGHRGRPFEFDAEALLCGFGFVVLCKGRTGVQALGIDVAIDKLDHGQRRIVTIAEAGLEDADVAALTLGI